MRKSSFKFRSIWPLGVRLAGLSCLAVLLLIPVSTWANPTRKVHRSRAAVHRARRRLHASGSPAVPVSDWQPNRHSRVHGRSAHSLSITQYRRRQERRARGRHYRLEATLDHIRTHTHPAELATSAEETVPAGTQMEVPHPVSLIASDAQPTEQKAPGEGATAPQENAYRRDLPVFNMSVPRYMPVALRGSHEVLIHQNIIADVEGLRRIQNDSQLSAMVRSGDLVALPASSALMIDSRLPLNRRYCRPWTAKFLSDISRAHQEVFGQPLQLTSAVRTIAFQRHLAHYNGNAAPAYGDTASPHLTGQAIDLGKKGMSHHEIAWMRTILGQLQASGKLDVEEEFEQACFHISVYKTYAPHSSLPTSMIASNGVAPVDVPQARNPAAANAAIGAVAHPNSAPVTRSTWTRHGHSYVAHATRRTVARHRRHHRRSMSLLAVRMR